MKDIKCPYCGADNKVNHDDGCGYAEDELHQMQCGSCDKDFVFTTAIIFHYSAHKADCLNDGVHDYQITNTYPKRYSRLRCSMCGDEKSLPKDHPFLTEEFKI